MRKIDPGALKGQAHGKTLIDRMFRQVGGGLVFIVRTLPMPAIPIAVRPFIAAPLWIGCQCPGRGDPDGPGGTVATATIGRANILAPIPPRD